MRERIGCQRHADRNVERQRTQVSAGQIPARAPSLAKNPLHFLPAPFEIGDDDRDTWKDCAGLVRMRDPCAVSSRVRAHCCGGFQFVAPTGKSRARPSLPVRAVRSGANSMPASVRGAKKIRSLRRQYVKRIRDSICGLRARRRQQSWRQHRAAAPNRCRAQFASRKRSPIPRTRAHRHCREICRARPRCAMRARAAMHRGTDATRAPATTIALAHGLAATISSHSACSCAADNNGVSTPSSE